MSLFRGGSLIGGRRICFWNKVAPFSGNGVALVAAVGYPVFLERASALGVIFGLFYER